MTVRTQAERDATTVEISFAFVSAAALAGIAFLVVAAPALFFDASGAWLLAAKWVSAVAFVARVASVLLRRPLRQPSQPGRTRPDS